MLAGFGFLPFDFILAIGYLDWPAVFLVFVLGVAVVTHDSQM